jgi:hypothetical protein
MMPLIRTNTFPFPGANQNLFFKWSIYVLGCLFFLNCFSPLRLHYDMLRYFAIKDCIESKCPPGADPKDYMPYGYTALLLVLSKLGMLRSFSIIFINCLYLFAGLYFVRKIFNYIRSPYFLFFLILLNWTVIKFVAHPLSELQYLFFSLGSVYAFYLFTLEKKITHLILAFLLAGFAFLTRTVGVSLVVALLVSLIWEYRKVLIALLRKNKLALIIIGICIAIVLIFSKQLGLNHYTGVMSKQFNEGLHLSDVIQWHFSEWGEIFLNISKFKLISLLPGKLTGTLFFIAGLTGICFLIYICFIKKNQIPFIVKAYLLFYMLLLFNWPFPDPRFWVPVLPLVAAVICQTSISLKRPIRIVGFLYLLGYILMGLVSIGFFTYTSLNKKEFARTQAKGVYRNEYEVHFFGRTLSDTSTYVDPNLVDFLNKYDR